MSAFAIDQEQSICPTAFSVLLSSRQGTLARTLHCSNTYSHLRDGFRESAGGAADMDRDVMGVYSDGSDHVGASTLTQECIMIDRDRALTFCGVHKMTYWSMVENGKRSVPFHRPGGGIDDRPQCR